MQTTKSRTCLGWNAWRRAMQAKVVSRRGAERQRHTWHFSLSNSDSVSSASALITYERSSHHAQSPRLAGHASHHRRRRYTVPLLAILRAAIPSHAIPAPLDRRRHLDALSHLGCVRSRRNHCRAVLAHGDARRLSQHRLGHRLQRKTKLPQVASTNLFKQWAGFLKLPLG